MAKRMKLPFNLGISGLTAPEFKQLRRLAGLTQEQAARALDVTHRTILRWESGDSRIGVLKAPEIRRRLLKRIFSVEERTPSES
jgi:DNA-binding XRE family transcriptional regulator